MKVFRHSGDAGDLVHSLAILQETPNGPHDLLLVDRPHTKALTTRSGLVIPLIERQPYINSIRCSEEEPDVDLAEFRTFHRADVSLMVAQQNYVNSKHKLGLRSKGREPWLFHVEHSKDSKDKVVVARSPRYHNHLFPWQKIVDHYGPERILFMGPDEEYKSFCLAFGHVPNANTKDLLEVAKLIQGSEVFIGNQSSPLSVAEGLKHPRIAEICLGVCDVIFKDDKAQWVAHGSVVLPDVAGSGELVIESQLKAVKLPHEINRGCPPPCQWWWGEMHSMSLKELSQRVSRIDRTKTETEWGDAILLNTMQKFPEHFKDFGKQAMLTNYIDAMRKAGYDNFTIELEQS